MLSDKDRKKAWDAIDHARATRRALRRSTRKNDTVRRNALTQSLRELKRAMKPLRTELGRTQYEAPSDYRDQLLALSAELQRERRKLWKMKQPPKRIEHTLLDRIRYNL